MRRHEVNSMQGPQASFLGLEFALGSFYRATGVSWDIQAAQLSTDSSGLWAKTPEQENS